MGLPRSPTIKEAVAQVVDCIDVHMTEVDVAGLQQLQNPGKTSEDDGKVIEAVIVGHRSMKMVTVVDEDGDYQSRVEWAMVTWWQPDRDTQYRLNQKVQALTLHDMKMD